MCVDAKSMFVPLCAALYRLVHFVPFYAGIGTSSTWLLRQCRFLFLTDLKKIYGRVGTVLFMCVKDKGEKKRNPIAMKSNRLIIHRKDIMRITGNSDRYARNLMTRMREYYKKDRKHFITIEEFCEYTGLKPDDVRALLN
jgi:hypothetical protein